jgi:hypothetical protein
MSFAPRQQPGPSRQERQSEMEAITIQQERDEEERRLRAEEEAKNKAERERLMREQQAAAVAVEASAFGANTTSKPTEIEETVKIKTNPITGEQTTTLEEKVPAGVPTSIGPVSPNMEGGAAPIPLTPTATAKPVSPDMEGGAAPVAMGAGTLTPTVGAPGSIPTLQDTLGAADEAGATVTPGSTPATSGVEGQAVAPTASFTDQAKGFLEKFEPYKKPDEQPGLPSLGSATLGGGVGARSGGATLRPGEMPKAVMPTMPSAPAQAPGVTPQLPGAGSVVQAPKPISTQIGTPQGGMVLPDQREIGPSIPQTGITPVSYQVPGDDAYAMAQQQNYPMDELGNYYAPNGQVIRPGTTMADLTSVSPGGFAPTPNWTAQSGEKFVADKKFYPLTGGQQFDSPAQAYMAEKQAEREQIGPGIDSATVPVIRTEQENAILAQKNEMEGGIPGLVPVDVEDATKTVEAQVLANSNDPDALKKVITSETVDVEVKDIAKENLKLTTLDKVKQEKAEVKGNAIIAKAAAGDKTASKQLAKAIAPSTRDEGSYFKAYLLQRFGLTELARAEQKKLGSDWARPTYRTINDDSGKVIGKVLVDHTGFAISGIDKAGNAMTRKAIDAGNYLTYNPTLSKHQKGGGIQLAAIGTKGQPGFIEAENITYRTNPDGTIDWAKDSKGEIITDAGKLAKIQTQVSTAKTTTDRGVATSTRVRDAKGVEWSQVPTKTGMLFYDNSGVAGIPSGKTVPITVSGDVGLQKKLAETKAGVTLKYAGAIEATKAGASEIGKFNATNGTNIGFITYAPGAEPILVDKNNNNQPLTPDTNGNITAVPNSKVAPVVPGATTEVKPVVPGEKAVVPEVKTEVKTEEVSVAPVFQTGAGNEAESIAQFNTRVKKYEQEQALIKQKKEAEIATVTKSNDQRVLDANNLLKTSEFSQAVGSQELIPGYIKLLTENKTNFGGPLQGQFALGNISAEQFFGDLIKTEEGRNTKQILDLINETILPGVKALGANPTDTDLQFIIKYKPKVTDPPQDIAQYLARVQKVFNRSYTDAQKVIESNGTYVPKFEFIKGEVDKSNPLLQGVN